MNNVYVTFGSNMNSLFENLFRGRFLEQYVSPNDHIVIKPNVLLPRDSKSGATTDPLLVDLLIQDLRLLGVKKITIAEGAWIGANTFHSFEVCGYKKLASKYDIELVDLKKDEFEKVPIPLENSELGSVKIAKTILEADKVINIPVLKAHCQTNVTCGMKNFMGVISDNEKRRFHRLNLHRCIFELNTICKADLIICDGLIGDITFEEGGNPVEFNRLIASDNIYAIDCYAANVLGYEIADVKYLDLYREYFSISEKYNLVRLNESKTKMYQAINYKKKFKCGINTSDACCSCLASIFTFLEERGYVKEQFEFHVGTHVKKEDIKKDKLNIFVGQCNKEFEHLGVHIKGCPPSKKDFHKAFKLLESDQVQNPE